MINKYKRTINREYEKSSFWPTFTDLLSSLLMVVILVLFSSESITSSVENDLANNINNSLKDTIDLNSLPVEVDVKTGQITFGEKTMFDTDSSQLKSEAKEMLNIFIPKYIETIYKNYGDNISKIIVEGHTDDIGTYMYNLELSQRRAYSVVEYIIGDEIGDYKYKDRLLKNIVSIGRSEAELIKNQDGNINREASRRVEIKYELNIE